MPNLSTETVRNPTCSSPVPREDVRILHELKCWPQFFEAIAKGHKRHDLRRADDRDFRVGDRLRLREFDPGFKRYTGREQIVEVTYITSAKQPCALSEGALDPGYCILSIASVTPE
jgi:Domain of unknown function (DUF3850)